MEYTVLITVKGHLYPMYYVSKHNPNEQSVPGTFKFLGRAKDAKHASWHTFDNLDDVIGFIFNNY